MIKYEIINKPRFNKKTLKSENRYYIIRKYKLFDSYFHDNQDNLPFLYLCRGLCVSLGLSLFFLPLNNLLLIPTCIISSFYFMKYLERFSALGYNHLDRAEEIKNELVKHHYSVNKKINITTLNNGNITIENL